MLRVKGNKLLLAKVILTNTTVVLGSSIRIFTKRWEENILSVANF